MINSILKFSLSLLFASSITLTAYADSNADPMSNGAMGNSDDVAIASATTDDTENGLGSAVQAAIDDATITANIKIAYAQDKLINGSEIEVKPLVALFTFLEPLTRICNTSALSWWQRELMVLLTLMQQL